MNNSFENLGKNKQRKAVRELVTTISAPTVTSEAAYKSILHIFKRLNVSTQALQKVLDEAKSRSKWASVSPEMRSACLDIIGLNKKMPQKEFLSYLEAKTNLSSPSRPVGRVKGRITPEGVFVPVYE